MTYVKRDIHTFICLKISGNRIWNSWIQRLNKAVKTLLATVHLSLFHHGYWQLQADIPIAWQYQLYDRFSVPRTLTIAKGVGLTLICPINPIAGPSIHPCCWLLWSVPLQLYKLKINESISPKEKKWDCCQKKRGQLWEQPAFSQGLVNSWILDR